MANVIRATFWVVTFGGIGYSLFKVVKPTDELLKEFDQYSKHTTTRKLSKDTISILKQASDPTSDVSKKVDDMLKGGRN